MATMREAGQRLAEAERLFLRAIGCPLRPLVRAIRWVAGGWRGEVGRYHYGAAWGVVHEDGHVDILPGYDRAQVERFAREVAEMGRYEVKWITEEGARDG